MFQFPAFPVLTDLMLKSHSGIPGSKTTCVYPGHSVACHTLHQHLKPSHPPNSVSTLCMVSFERQPIPRIKYFIYGVHLVKVDMSEKLCFSEHVKNLVFNEISKDFTQLLEMHCISNMGNLRFP